jgi:enoyl-CoA hydratase/carnithine racemase
MSFETLNVEVEDEVATVTLEYLYKSRDHAEAVKAFREKRVPRFDGA